MKRIRAYGGIANLYNVGAGWEYEFWSRRRYSPPRQLNWPGLGKPVYMSWGGSHGFGSARTMADARRFCVNALKSAAR